MESNVFNQDCMLGLREIEDKFFDLAIVDPPYMENFSTQNWVGTCAPQKKYKDNVGMLNNAFPTHDYFKELSRVSKNQIVWGGNYFADKLPISRGWIVWYKSNQDNYFSDCEVAWTSFDRVAKVFEFTWSGMLQQNMKDKEIRIHPTQKPKALYKWLLKNYASLGDKILDTHMGSQSSRIAAYDMGFDYWGYEIDKDYFEAGCKRFELFKSQLKLELA